MKKLLSLTAIPLALVLSASAWASPDKHGKPKHSAEHAAAIKKCTEDYRASLKEAKTKKGRDRKEAESAARQSRKECVAGAPM
ncbi:MAG TPA: hypothetical protein VM934_07110 [Pyrinomonadaceae bacterium]|nr:hypothetical protein [Pyrinomonadaceae bacterium]